MKVTWQISVGMNVCKGLPPPLRTYYLLYTPRAEFVEKYLRWARTKQGHCVVALL